MGVVVGFAGPDGMLVELDALVGGAAEDHGAHAAVADGQGFGPESGGLVVPESEGGSWADGGGAASKVASARRQLFHRDRAGREACPTTSV